MENTSPSYVVFEGSQRIATGPLREVALIVKEKSDADPQVRLLVFNAISSELIDFDLRGTADDVISRLALLAALEAPTQVESAQAEPPAPAGPGRPKLGVVAREVTLLPRHWDWLKSQPGGASVALRKLVEQAKRASAFADRVRQAQNSAFHFMSVMAGNREGFEEAARALFAADQPRFQTLIAAWPLDVQEHLLRIADLAFQKEADQEIPSP